MADQGTPHSSPLADANASPEGSDSDVDPGVEQEEDLQEAPEHFDHQVRMSTASSVRSVDGDALQSEEVDLAEEAGQVYVMMDGTFRVSRNTRAQWFLEYLNKTVVWNPEEKTDPEECEPLEIISCIPRRPAFPAGDVTSQSTKRSYRITQNTAVTFLSKTYRLVFALDLTPSMSAVSVVNKNIAFEELFLALRDCFTAISQPTLIPGTSTAFTPKVFITVLAHAPFLSAKSAPVIVKGFKLLPETLPLLLKIIHQELLNLEDDVIPRLNAEVKKYSTFVPTGDSKVSKPFITMDMTLANILRKGLLSAQLLPDNSCGHIVVVTDGIVDFPDVTVMDALLSQLRTNTISVSFIRVGCTSASSSIGSDFGYLCNTDLMEFIAKSTSGAYVEHKPLVGEMDGSDASIFQKAFFTWNFQQGVDGVTGDLVKRPESFAFDAIGNRIMHQCYTPRSTLDVSVGGLLSIRLREGFTIKNVSFSKGNSHIDMTLSMPWKPEISLEYRISAVWPPTDGTPVTAEIHVEAPYEFLYDLTCPSPKSSYGKYRQATLKQFKHTVQSLEQTDMFLLHFEQFRSSPAHFTLPDVIRDGMPVFYFPPDDLETPVFSTDDLVDHLEFANFWRPLCVMDVNLWHKWLHVHRISILLEHDRPLLTNIFSPKRVPTVRCSLALNQLHDLLRTWSTIVLVDSHSYVRFIFDEGEGMDIPKSFFIVRMAAKPPCVVLRLAFLGGTSGNVRHKIISELEDMLSKLTIHVKSAVHSEQTGVLCCWKLAKPVEKMLIQYKDIPSDMFNPSLTGPVNQEKSTQTLFPVANPGAFQALSRFLYCRRYVWLPFKGPAPLLFFDVIGRVLTALIRLRLREGFRFASTSGGVFNLTMEIEMKDVPGKGQSVTADNENAKNDFPPCVAQYIIFPPRSVRDSVREEDREGDLQDQKYSIAVEVWLEPQYGISVATGTPAAYLDGLKYKELPDKIHETDTELLSILLTFETLFAVCDPGKHGSIPRRPWHGVPAAEQSMISSVIAVHPPAAAGLDENADVLDFPLDIPRFMAKCQRTRMLFSSFRQSRLAKSVDASNELLFRYFVAEVRRLHAREVQLTRKDCLAIFDLLRDGEEAMVQGASLTSSSTFDEEPVGGVGGVIDATGDANQSSGVEWKAFVRKIADNLLIVTLVPASYAHLRTVNLALDISDIEGTGSYSNVSTGPQSGGDSTAVSHGEGDSETDEMFASRSPTALPVPVFIFSCSFESLQSVIVDRKTLSRSANMEFDLTSSFNCTYDRLQKRISECRPDDYAGSDRGASLRSSSFSMRSHKDNNKLFVLCAALEDAFAKAFVQGVYKSLHLGLPVDPYDIQTAVDGVCDEIPVEVDLTSFIKAICPHFRELTGRRSRRSSGTPRKSTDNVSQLYPRPPPETHSSIRAQFQTAIAACLKVATNKPDVFYFSMPGFQDLSGDDGVSTSEVERNSSDASESSDFFRLDSVNLRQNVRGVSEADSAPGFFVIDPDSASINGSGDSNGSVFGSSPSGATGEQEADYDEDEDGLQNPLFVQFFCTVLSAELSGGSRKSLGSCVVRELPTCLNDILTAIDHTGALKNTDLSDIQIRLDVLCLSLPEELKNILTLEGRSSMRTISSGSSATNLRGSDSDISTIHEESTGIPDVDVLVQLPLEQSEKMRKMLDGLKWHLQDEIAYMLSNGEGMPSEENLRLVVQHVQHNTSKTRFTCRQLQIPLKFVFNIEQSYTMFIERFEKVVIHGYRFVKEGEFYCLTTHMGSPLQTRRRPPVRTFLSDSGSDHSKLRARSPSVDLDLQHPSQRSRISNSRRASLPVFTLNRELHGIVNPINNADIKAFSRLPSIIDSLSVGDEENCIFEGGETQDTGYDAGSSESEDEHDVKSLTSGEATSRAQLPGFWLILRLTSSEAGLFFHVRESESPAGVMQKHSELIDEVSRKIRAAAKLVNQELLLENLLTTRRCHNLLEPETSEEIWKVPGGQDTFIKVTNGAAEDLDPEGVDGSYLEASMHFKAGFFRCDVVYEHEFIVHPRLKTGPGRSGSRAVSALKVIIDKFAVSNRQNMYVLEDKSSSQKDTTGAIFYFRLQDKSVARRFAGNSIDEPTHPRGRDVEQLAGSSLTTTLPELESSPSHRSVASFDEFDGAGASPGFAKNLDAIVFSFYGICQMSEKFSRELVTVLQNRLDEAVLESLTVSLSRNTMLKLNVDDVRFVQPFKSEPADILELDLPRQVTEHKSDLFQVFHYVLQNLCGFLHCPKYLDVDDDRHFHFMDRKTGWESAEDEASFLYNRSHESGNRGLAFVYVIFNTSKVLPESQATLFDWPSLNLLEELAELTKVRPVTLGGDLSFHIWEKGNIDRPALIDKLTHSVHHALLDFWMEKSIVPKLRHPGSTSLPAANCSLLQSFLKIGVDCKCPAYQSSTFTLPSRRAVDLIAEQIVGIVNLQSLSLNIAALVSKVQGGAELEPTEAKIEGTASMKEILLPRVKNLVPGSYIACRVLGMPPEEGDVYERRTRSVSTDATTGGDDKTKLRTVKRFMARVDYTGVTSVPRARLLYFSITDVACQVYLYNFSTDTATTFEKAVARLFEWHHERHRFLNNILLQKCGIFLPMAAFESKPSAEMVSFASSPMQADALFSYANIPPKENLRNPQTSKHQSGSGTAALPNFSTVMEGGFPTRFFADTERKYGDPVMYHGKQFYEIRQRKRRAGEVRLRLHGLYEVWRTRDRRSITPEDTLALLKANAKPTHFVASPLLFDPQWRKNLGGRFPDRQLTCGSPVQRAFLHEDEPHQAAPAGARSRHSSGVPPTPAKEKQKLAAPVTVEPLRRPSGPTPEQQWHRQVQTILMTEYVHYLQLQGFSVVFAGPPISQRHIKKSPQSNTRATSGTSSPIPMMAVLPVAPPQIPRFTPACTYLQRCVPGGMILLELYFVEPFLFSRMYAVDRCKFSDDYSAVGNDPDKALLSLQREIDRLKVAMHMHSFLYDFHLRCLNKYISGKQLYFKQGYHLVSFFDDFGNYYQKPPSYAKSSFQTGTLTVPCGSIAAGQLYNYILDRDKQYGLNAVRMSSMTPDDDSDPSFALACSSLSCPDQAYEYSFILYADTHEPQLPGSCALVLRYYIILNSRKDIFSSEYLEERFGSFKTLPPPKRPRSSIVEGMPPALTLTHSSANLTVKDPVQEDQPERPSTAQETTENLTPKASLISAFPNFLYIGYFSSLETELSRIVEEQKILMEGSIRKVFGQANSDCVRDTLWQRLAAVKTGDTDAPRKRADFAQARHREESGSSTFTARALPDVSRSIPRLTSVEFEDLVAHVYREPIVQWDPELSIFFQANAVWLEGLLDTLKVKYWDVQRFFVTSHGSPHVVQHLVIVCDKLVDIALYLTLKTGASTIDACILSRNPISLPELRGNAVFIESVQGFVNACCFHMWKAGLPA